MGSTLRQQQRQNQGGSLGDDEAGHVGRPDAGERGHLFPCSV